MMKENIFGNPFEPVLETATRRETLLYICSVLHNIIPERINVLGEDLDDKFFRDLTTIIGGVDVSVIDDEYKDVREAITDILARVLEEHAKVNAFLSDGNAIDIFSYFIYVTNAYELLCSDEVRSSDICTDIFISMMTNMFSDAKGVKSKMDADECAIVVMEANNFYEGFSERVMNAYNNNPTVKYKECISDHKVKVSACGLDELDVQFIELLKKDNAVAILLLTDLIRNVKTTVSEDEDACNLNGIYMDNLLSTYKDKFMHDDVGSVANHILTLLAKM